VIKKKTIIRILVTSVVTALILISGFCIWFSRICTPEMTLVQLSSVFRVTIPSKPDASARLYSLGRDRFLLVLTARSSKYPEGYYLNMFHGEIGLPDFPDYIPLYKYALVDRRIYDGFPTIGELKADWSVKGDRDEVRICFKGFEEGLADDDDELLKTNMPIGYQNEIILTKKF